MKYKCFWEKEDVVGGLIVRTTPVCESASFMILSRGFSTGESEYSIVDLGSGVVLLATFVSRSALADWLTENDYEPVNPAREEAA
jgi:hypothetical protein